MNDSAQLFDLYMKYPENQRAQIIGDWYSLPRASVRNRWDPNGKTISVTAPPRVTPAPPMPVDTEIRRDTSQHEAAHAVAVLHHGGKVHRISVSDDGSGYIKHSPMSGTADLGLLKAPYVECGGRWCDAIYSSDRQQLLEVMREIVNRDRPSYMGPSTLSDAALEDLSDRIYSSEDLMDLLDRNRRFIDALTDHLVEHGFASEDTVHAFWEQYGQKGTTR